MVMPAPFFLLKNIKKEFADTRSPLILASHSLRCNPGDIQDVVILREALDARKKGNLHRVYTLAISLKSGDIPDGFSRVDFPSVNLSGGGFEPRERPVIVGAGPAGLFCALVLVRKGYCPLILEQGKPVAERLKDVTAIAKSGRIDGQSNVLFGEGGAGTFSDGKLTARNSSAETDFFFRSLIEFGAAPCIGYQAKPHLGSDALRKIIPEMTHYLVREGAEIRYGYRVSGLRKGPGGRVVLSSGSGELASDCVILAVGHSADELYRSLLSEGVALAKKTFAVGLRVEHPREFIDDWQYGRGHNPELTGAADYKLTDVTGDGRGVYSFCVCPGGEIINASSRDGRVGVNGMSWSGRSGAFTNGAIVVTVLPEDLPGHPLSGLEFRKAIEEKCHAAGPLFAPSQSLKDFLDNRKGTGNKSSYRPGTFDADINGLLPGFVVKGLLSGFSRFDRQIRGFVQNGVLVAPETGTSSPVRILRDPETFQSVNLPGLFPIGEGAGYSGGIVSSAADGIRLALRFRCR
jgi:uncharacterized FAD-dependent dehydrogenase